MTALGLKMVNTDKAFETGLKKAGLGMFKTIRGADFKVDPIRKRKKDYYKEYGFIYQQQTWNDF